MYSLSNKYYGDKYETFDTATRADDSAVDRKDVFERKWRYEWQPSHDTEELQSQLGDDIDRWTIYESEVSYGTRLVTADK